MKRRKKGMGKRGKQVMGRYCYEDEMEGVQDKEAGRDSAARDSKKGQGREEKERGNHVNKRIELRLKQYYANGKRIQDKTEQVEKLTSRLKKIEEDIQNANKHFRLSADLQAVSYGSEKTAGGALPASKMDRQIERIFTKIEQEREETLEEILLANLEIRRLSKENDGIERLLGRLTDEVRDLVYLRYSNGESFEKIAARYHMSKSNICKKIYGVLFGLQKLDEDLRE